MTYLHLSEEGNHVRQDIAEAVDGKTWGQVANTAGGQHLVRFQITLHLKPEEMISWCHNEDEVFENCIYIWLNFEL